jgi:fructose-bisphosphate aldolase class II
VMHGSSTVPQNLQDLINENGGAMKQTYGVPVEEIVKGIKVGVRKVNIDTDNRMAITAAIRKVFQESPEAFDPRKYLTPAMTAMTEVCMLRYEAFNTAGQAGKIKAISLTDMAASYSS